MTRNAKRLTASLICAALTLCAAVGIYLDLRQHTPSAEESKTRYLRAVHVLRSFGGPAGAEPVNTPPRIIYSDDTESLLHHPDKILVLSRIADDLAACRSEFTQAGLFEAYARLGMGDKRVAANLLMHHVAVNPYNPRHYALLCKTLYETEDFTSLLIICQEWAEHDPRCLENRFRYTFAALYTLGRFADAEKTMREAEPCLGWRAVPYAAKAHLALGRSDEAEHLLREGLNRHPASAQAMLRLWEQLQNRDRL